MQLKYKKKKSEWFSEPFAVPVTLEMKAELAEVKKSVDVNSMAREYFQMLIDKYKTQKACGQ